MTSWTIPAVVVVFGYLLGSVPFGLVIARARGVDIRQRGSGNIGATNVARNLGKKLGVLVLLLDALKGALPVIGATLLGLEPLVICAVGWAAIVGHCFPVWLGFRGGKGVATSLGVLIVIDPAVTALSAVAFAMVVGATRMVSLGSLVAMSSFPIAAWALGRPSALVLLGVATAAVVLIQHRDNLRRIVRGTEHRFR